MHGEDPTPRQPGGCLPRKKPAQAGRPRASASPAASADTGGAAAPSPAASSAGGGSGAAAPVYSALPPSPPPAAWREDAASAPSFTYAASARPALSTPAVEHIAPFGRLAPAAPSPERWTEARRGAVGPRGGQHADGLVGGQPARQPARCGGRAAARLLDRLLAGSSRPKPPPPPPCASARDAGRRCPPPPHRPLRARPRHQTPAGAPPQSPVPREATIVAEERLIVAEFLRLQAEEGQA